MSILDEIIAKKREVITADKEFISESAMMALAKRADEPRGFIASINKKITAGEVAIIAEAKKASPSRGLIREDFNPAEIAKSYERAGAACISVLTDNPYFMGRDEYIRQVRKACDLPILRKDFIIEPYQVAQARAIGADAILLIAAALSDIQMRELEQTANNFGLDVLVEVHNEEELQRALKLQTSLIGVNNRNLKTMEVDINTSIKLQKLYPEDKVIVCESGIKTAEDIAIMRKNNINAFLIGESLMREDNIELALHKLLA